MVDHQLYFASMSRCKCQMQVVGDVLALNGIARHLKAGRASNGALRLDNTKLYFHMDDKGNPISAAPYGGQHSQLHCVTLLVCCSYS